MARLSDIVSPRPTEQSLAECYDAIERALDRPGIEARTQAIADWDAAKREVETWITLAYIRFHQDTADIQAKADQAHGDAIKPKATAHDIRLKRRLLAERDRAGLEQLVGAHAVRLWQLDVTTFDPLIASDLVQEAALVARYTELTGSAKLVIDGRTVNLSGLAPYLQDPDREVRHEAARLRWSFFADNGAELDRIFDQLVGLRHGMARKLGHENFVALGYQRMRRTDYGPTDVAAYRDQIVAEVVPLMTRILERRRVEFGWDHLRAWDEPITDPKGNPTPIGDQDRLITEARRLFAAMDPRLGQFSDMMAEQGLLDLDTRPTKARGGFCTMLPTPRTPFIFANFTATHHDVNVLVHEMGHAFQCWESRRQPVIEYLWPTMDACEIHSMGLEYLVRPSLDRLFGDAADRYRHLHLVQSLGQFTMCAAGDHFQHLVYERPTASSAERHEMWRTLERRYMPWRDYGDLAYPAMGGSWQWIPHLYGSPFYFIDYALALCVAMQLGAKSVGDPAGTFETYAALCACGGSASFVDLVQGAGLISPFADGALAAALAAAKRELLP